MRVTGEDHRGGFPPLQNRPFPEDRGSGMWRSMSWREEWERALRRSGRRMGVCAGGWILPGSLEGQGVYSVGGKTNGGEGLDRGPHDRELEEVWI